MASRAYARHTYSETIDEPALTAIFDLNQARSMNSFDKCYRDLRLLIERFRGSVAEFPG